MLLGISGSIGNLGKNIEEIIMFTLSRAFSSLIDCVNFLVQLFIGQLLFMYTLDPKKQENMYTKTYKLYVLVYGIYLHGKGTVEVKTK